MSVKTVPLTILAGFAWFAVFAKNGTVTDLASTPELWKSYPGTEAAVPPEMSVIKGPNGAPAVEFTVKADGVYQAAVLTPEEPIALEHGDLLKLKLRQTAEHDPYPLTLNGQFTCGGMNFTTKPVANKWTEITVPLDPANWRSSKDTPSEFGALKKLSIYPARRLDQIGEVLSIAEMTIVKADGSLRAVAVPDSRRPTEAELKWLAPENWKGYLGNASVKTPPAITFEDTPDGKAVFARPVDNGPYQGIAWNLLETIDLAKVKAITFDLRQNTGNNNCCVWLNYAPQGSVRCNVPTRNQEWVPVRLTLDFNPQTFTASPKGAKPAPGMLKQIVITCYGSLDAPDKELGVRNLHFVMKTAE